MGIFFKTVALTAAFAVLCSCSRKDSAVYMREKGVSSDITRISFFGNKYEAANVVVIEEIIDSYLRLHPDLALSYESLKGNSYYEALKKRVASGNADDIFMVNQDAVLDYSADGLLADLSDLKNIEGFIPSVYDQMKTADGRIYFVPTSVSAFGLYCNMDLLKKHGFVPPKTYGEFISMCEYFKNFGITPIVANNDISIKTLIIARAFYPYYMNGSIDEVFNRINSGEKNAAYYLKPGLETASLFVRRGYIDASAALSTAKTQDDLSAFASGKSPFMMTGAWAAGRMRSLNPTFDFKVYPYPLGDNCSVTVINLDTRLAVNASGKRVRQSKDFVDYFLRPENIFKFVNNQSSISPVKDKPSSDNPDIAPILSHVKNGVLVMGTDNRMDFSIWETLTHYSYKLLSGKDDEELYRWLSSALNSRSY